MNKKGVKRNGGHQDLRGGSQRADLQARLVRRAGLGLLVPRSRSAPIASEQASSGRASYAELVRFHILYGQQQTRVQVSVLGANLRRERKRLKLTQVEVAERSGVHVTEISRIESGKRDPQVSTVERIAEALELRTGRLFD